MNCRIKVSNILDVETIGTVYSYIAVPSTLIIQIPSQTAAGSSFNYKVLRTSNIKSLEVISKKIDSSKIAKITEVDASQVPQITKRNTEAIELKKKTWNENATKEGQHIFNSVYKTMPNVRWKGTSIIILDEVQIDPPYGLDSIKSILKSHGQEDDGIEESDAIRLVKKIVDGVWLKFENEQKGG